MREDNFLFTHKFKKVIGFLKIKTYEIDREQESPLVQITKYDIWSKIFQFVVTDDEIRLGDIWKMRPYHYFVVRAVDLRAVGIPATNKGLQKVFEKISKISNSQITFTIEDFNRYSIEGKQELFISLRAVNATLEVYSLALV